MMNLRQNASNRLLIAGLILVGGFCIAGSALARSRPGGGGDRHLGMLRTLDLNPEQKAAVDSLLPAYREEKDALRERMQAARKTMQTLMTADALDETGIREASRDMAPVMEEMAVLRARFMFDLKEILTPEQAAQLEARQKEGMARRHKHRTCTREGMPGPPGAPEAAPGTNP